MMRKLLVCTALLTCLGAVHAVTLRVANQGDVLSMDPHSLLETLQISFTGNVYEPLVGRDKQMQLVPLLATEWSQMAPTTWRFKLRRGVLFHDGTPFSADDVVFSFKRALGDGSDLRARLVSVETVRKIDDFTIDIDTRTPFAILPDVIANVYMMSRKWCEENKAEKPVDRRRGIENVASFKANGTGPFRLRERQPSLRTVLTRNFAYWDKVESNLDEVVFTPIANDATRLAALLSGEIDLMEPVPLQDVDRIKALSGFNVVQGPEVRTLFLGMDQKRDELLYSSAKGRNPFKDKRVRQAFYQAIDIEAIKSRVMRGAATPTALMVAPGMRGFQPDMNKRLPHDTEVARRLLAEAGYPNGFELTLNCPNDRWVNDAAICQAVAAHLARVGVKINLQTESKATYFPRMLRRDTSFYLFSWAPGTVDSLDSLTVLMATPDSSTGQGQ
jgi:peptide/nickel transport system substrate-binding protein